MFARAGEASDAVGDSFGDAESAAGDGNESEAEYPPASELDESEMDPEEDPFDDD